MKKILITLIFITAACFTYAFAQKTYSLSQFKAASTDAKVIRAIDGDTVEVQIGDKTEKVRLLGLDTPELKDERPQIKCFAEQAKKKTAEIEGLPVKLESDSSQGDKDRYGRLLRYIWVYSDDRSSYNFNQVIIRKGYAYEYTYNKPYKYQDDFKAAQKAAEKDKSGLWDPTSCSP